VGLSDLRKQKPGVTNLSSADKETKGWKSFMSLRPLQPLPEIDLQSGCWSELFDRALVAPAPGVRHQAPCRGLELPWEKMIQLAAVEYPVLVESGPTSRPGLVFLGYSTALIPIRETKDQMILWHLEVASHDRQIKISELQATRSRWLRTKDFDFLASKRALLGWCSQADLRLGASTDDLNVTWSSEKKKPFSWELTNINLQTRAQSASPAQFSIQAGASWKHVNNKVKFSPSRQYLKCLNRSMLEQIVLDDVATMRAWLVPLISVSSHVVSILEKDSEEISSKGRSYYFHYLSLPERILRRFGRQWRNDHSKDRRQAKQLDCSKAHHWILNQSGQNFAP
jgi:hypothetical protein